MPPISLQGVEPRWKGLNSAIPVVMVSKRAYSILVAESYSGSRIVFQADRGVPVAVNGSDSDSQQSMAMSINGATWEPLEKLSKGEVRACVRGRYSDVPL